MLGAFEETVSDFGRGTRFSPAVLNIDPAAETERIVQAINVYLFSTLRRRGAVLGISGGVDSAVVAALCVRAIGNDNVLGLLMPERDSSRDSLQLGTMLVQSLGLQVETEDIGHTLESAGCYRRRDAAIRSLVPEYGPGWKCKLMLPSVLAGERLNVTRLMVQTPAGEIRTVRLTVHAYLQLVAATNYKQRVRKMTEYYHAERLNYAVAGTSNRLEYDQGVFVKQDDGVSDFKPIAHLYKTQVYQLAGYLGIPKEICERPPTTDTFPMEQSQEEFHFALPYECMDLCLYAHNHHVPARQVAPLVHLSPEQVEHIFRDIEAKRRTTRHLHLPPLLVEPVAEV